MGSVTVGQTQRREVLRFEVFLRFDDIRLDSSRPRRSGADFFEVRFFEATFLEVAFLEVRFLEVAFLEVRFFEVLRLEARSALREAASAS